MKSMAMNDIDEGAAPDHSDSLFPVSFIAFLCVLSVFALGGFRSDS